DVAPGVLVDENHPELRKRGTAHRHTLKVGDVEHPSAARVYGDDAINGIAGHVKIEWDAVDEWYEEDEQVFVHPRNPYTRVDALHEILACAYAFPTRQLLPIAGLVSFYNEQVDLFIDGEPVERAVTHFFP